MNLVPYISRIKTLCCIGGSLCTLHAVFVFHPELTKVVEKVTTWHVFHDHVVWLLQSAAPQHGNHIGVATYPLHHRYLRQKLLQFVR